jgi:hypothetical protein
MGRAKKEVSLPQHQFQRTERNHEKSNLEKVALRLGLDPDISALLLIQAKQTKIS